MTLFIVAQKLKDIPSTKSRFRTVGQDPLKKGLNGPSLRQSHPALALEYIDKGPYSIDDLSPGSNRVVEWLHARCGEKIRVPICIRTRAWDEGTKDQGCYICAGRNPRPKKPQVIPEWLQYECRPNSRARTKIKDISPWSQTYWQYNCGSGTGTIFCSRIIDRLNPFTGDWKQGCPCDSCYRGECVNLLAVSASREPGKPNFWDMFIRTWKNSGFNPERLPSGYRVRWRCDKNPGHEFSRSFIELSEFGCPQCEKENDDNTLAASRYRDIVREFLFVLSDPELAPSQIKPGSHLVAAFRCSAGHTFKEAIYRRTQKNNPENCSFCAGKRSDAPTLFSVSPYLWKRWCAEKNVVVDRKTGETVPIDAERVLSDSSKKLWFYCHAGHTYRTSAVELSAGNDECPDCALLPNCVDNVRPEIVKEWDQKRNGNRTPWNTPGSSSAKVYWKCGAGPDHEWQAEVCKRVVKGTSCPFCANKQLSVTNSLQAVYPELARLMHPEDNNGRRAMDVIASTTLSVSWRCSCSKVYKRVLQHMLGRGSDCNDCRKAAKAKSKQEAETRKMVEK